LTDIPSSEDFSDIWESALQGSGTGLWDRSFAANLIRYATTWFDILGFDQPEPPCPIETAYSRVHPDDLAGVQASMQAHFERQTEFYDVEHRLRCKDGSYKWVHSRGQVIARDPAGNPLRMVGTTIDITARRNLANRLAEEHASALDKSERLIALTTELAERTEELRTAHRLAGIGAWRWDLERHALQFSPEIWGLFGRPPSTGWVSYEQMRELYYPDDYGTAIAAFGRMPLDKRPITLEYRVVHPDGSVRHVLSHAEPVLGPDGRVLQVRGTSQDITPFRKIEAALRASEDHYRHMVELHPQIPWTAGPDGGVLEAGPKWLELTGMTLAETLPFGWIEAVLPEDRARVAQLWQQSVSTGAPLDSEFRIRRSGGGVSWVRARATARLGAAGEVVRWYGSLDEVTDRYAAEAARRASEALALRVLESTSDAVLVFDHAGIATFANTKACLLLAQPKLVGRAAAEIFAGSHVPLLDALHGGGLAPGRRLNLEFRLQAQGLWLETFLFGGENDVSLFMRDISEKKRTEAQIQFAARHDALTGVFNRSEFFTRLAARVSRLPADSNVALLCFDLDYFKEINDSYGHPIGDKVLRLIADRMRRLLAQDDLICRLGGDEFIVARIGQLDTGTVEQFATAVLNTIGDSLVFDHLAFSVRASIGLTLDTVRRHSVEQIYRHADMALYEAKRLNKGNFLWFRPEMEARLAKAKTLHSDLAEALKREEFELAYQPIFHSADGRLAGAEALLRWHRPQRAAMSPAEFIPVAEDSGLIGRLGAWVLREACRTASAWPAHLSVSVNVSARQFELDNMADVVREALAESGLPARRLNLEITESVFIDRDSSNLRQLNALRTLGVNIVLDDFGTGYSSLSYLDTFRFDVVKIDKSFISKITSECEKHPVLEAILGMTRALKLPTTAEGVNTPAQLAHVRRLGCAYVQGFMLGRPGSAANLLKTPELNRLLAMH
jgi:diguanylate cyclase (GGDEF)-like protein/PAS domain S-box-containing protein